MPPSTFTDTPAPAGGAAHCASCDAVCCRMTVVLQEGDHIASHLTEHTAAGLEVMARDEFGWCVAVDPAGGGCSIYDSRPDVCRRFLMDGPYCRAVRGDYADRNARGIPLQMF
jgi:Fe-S-cluster containining protein